MNFLYVFYTNTDKKHNGINFLHVCYQVLRKPSNFNAWFMY